MYNMVGGAAGEAGTPSGHAAYNVRIGNLHVHRIVNALSLLLQCPCKSLCLGNGSGKAVQHIAVLAVRIPEAIHDQLQRQFIRHQKALVHIGLGLCSQLGSVLYICSENIARRNMGNLIFVSYFLCLCAFSCTWGPQHNNLHLVPP